jgi:hypothetical protein
LRLFSSLIISVFFLVTSFAGTARSQSPATVPPQWLKFKQSAALTPLKTEDLAAEAWSTEYFGNNGVRVTVEIFKFRQEPEAYQLMSKLAASEREKHPGLEIKRGYGTAGFNTGDYIVFFKGTTVVTARNKKGANGAMLEAFANDFSEGLDKGEGDIPVLVKHLPNPEEAQKNALYLNSFRSLDILPQPVLSAIQSDGNADAALATYGPSKLLLIEFNTPQLATDNDQRIIARIHELWKLGQPAPTAYRRVGNYSVFVFDAPDEATARQLIDQVKYEQVVQWLGENPNILKEAEKQYINTTLGVFVAVLKASGYALITCLGLGGLLGGLLFSYRRSRAKEATAYSDAGGMLRLNLDELTPETDPRRLLRERN